MRPYVQIVCSYYFTIINVTCLLTRILQALCLIVSSLLLQRASAKIKREDAVIISVCYKLRTLEQVAVLQGNKAVNDIQTTVWIKAIYMCTKGLFNYYTQLYLFINVNYYCYLFHRIHIYDLKSHKQSKRRLKM